MGTDWIAYIILVVCLSLFTVAELPGVYSCPLFQRDKRIGKFVFFGGNHHEPLSFLLQMATVNKKTKMDSGGCWLDIDVLSNCHYDDCSIRTIA